MSIMLITRRMEPSRSLKDQIRRLTYPRLNVAIITKWVTTKINVQRIQEIGKERDQANIANEAPPKKNKIEELEVKELYY